MTKGTILLAAAVAVCAPFAVEGRKAIQLYRMEERWLIASVLWEDQGCEWMLPEKKTPPDIPGGVFFS